MFSRLICNLSIISFRSNCEITSCSSIISSAAAVCTNLRGVCTDYNVCSCSAGYDGYVSGLWFSNSSHFSAVPIVSFMSVLEQQVIVPLFAPHEDNALRLTSLPVSLGLCGVLLILIYIPSQFVLGLVFEILIAGRNGQCSGHGMTGDLFGLHGRLPWCFMQY